MGTKYIELELKHKLFACLYPYIFAISKLLGIVFGIFIAVNSGINAAICFIVQAVQFLVTQQ